MASLRGYTKNGNTKVNQLFLPKQRQMEARLQGKLDAKKKNDEPDDPDDSGPGGGDAGCEALKWSLTFPSHYPCPWCSLCVVTQVKSAFGEAQHAFNNPLGQISLDESVTLNGHGITTKLIEGSMLAQAIVAIREAIDQLHLPVRVVCSWSDCLSAVQPLCSATLTRRPGHIFDRVVAAGNVTRVLQRFGWLLAQHDSNLKIGYLKSMPRWTKMRSGQRMVMHGVLWSSVCGAMAQVSCRFRVRK